MRRRRAGGLRSNSFRADPGAPPGHFVLEILDADHEHLAENLDLVQHNVLVIADAAHAHSADNMLLAVPSDFGPTNGRQSVIDNAGPRAVAEPQSYVEITTSDNANINTILTNNPGATFYFRAGTYNRTSTIVPKANQTLVLESGAILDGGSNNFGAAIQINNTNGVTIRGGKIQNVGSNATGANGRGILVQGTSEGTTIEDVEVTSCYRSGVVVQTTTAGGTTVQYCYIHDNGQYGFNINANSAGTPGSDDVTFYRNEISGNNTQHANPGDDAGTCKIIDARNGGLNAITLTENYVHDNYGFGLWVDNGEPDTTGFTISENVCEDNLFGGIFYEVGGGGCTISRNYLKGNGKGDATYAQSLFNRWQIIISTSDGSLGVGTGILVELNDVDSTTNGNAEKLIGLVDFTRGEGTHVKQVTVQNNRLWCRTSSAQVGGFDDNTVHILQNEATNDFQDNEYHVVDLTHSNWKWPSSANGNVNRNFTAWQGFGFDTNATRTDEL